jgi:hypothetical protein
MCQQLPAHMMLLLQFKDFLPEEDIYEAIKLGSNGAGDESVATPSPSE